MTVQLNHTIVDVPDKQVSATFLAEMLGLSAPRPYGPFLVVDLDNAVELAFMDAEGHIRPQHYAFLLSEEEFDRTLNWIRDRELPYWADPHRQQPGRFNTDDGGRGLYWEEPAGHLLEIITRPYGSDA